MNTLHIVSLIALSGSLLAILARSKPEISKLIGLAVCVIEIGFLLQQPIDSMAMYWPALICLVGFISILGQSSSKRIPISSSLTLLAMAAILPNSLPSESSETSIYLALLFLILSGIAVSFRKTSRIGIGTIGVFVFALLTSVAGLLNLVSGLSTSVVMLILAAALMPLFPLHAGYIGILRTAPGSLASFLSVALPLTGLNVLSRVQDLPPDYRQVIAALAIGGFIFTALRTSVQVNCSRVVAGIGTLMFSVVWWLFASTGKLDYQCNLFVQAIALSVCGLQICCFQLHNRYGTQAVKSLPGLAKRMPKFSILFCLLSMSLVGVPLFAVFSGLVNMLANVNIAHGSQAIYIIVAIVWLSSSAIMTNVMQEFLFYKSRSDLKYTDLGAVETIALASIITMLLVGGLFPELVQFPMVTQVIN